jgi:hypothetical protein
MKKFQISLILVLNVTFAATAFAAGGGAAHGEVHFTWKDWLWPVVNFAILIFILVFFGRKPIGEKRGNHC